MQILVVIVAERYMWWNSPYIYAKVHFCSFLELAVQNWWLLIKMWSAQTSFFSLDSSCIVPSLEFRKTGNQAIYLSVVWSKSGCLQGGKYSKETFSGIDHWVYEGHSSSTQKENKMLTVPNLSPTKTYISHHQKNIKFLRFKRLGSFKAAFYIYIGSVGHIYSSALGECCLMHASCQGT